MKKRTKSLLEEINNMVHDRDKHLIIESKADHIIASAINLVQLTNPGSLSSIISANIKIICNMSFKLSIGIKSKNLNSNPKNVF